MGSPNGSNVHGVVLAAGLSERFGDRQKLLEPLEGEPLIRRALRPFLRVELGEVFVVVGHRSGAVASALDGLAVRVVENPDYEVGQSRSVRAGVCSAEEAAASGVLIGLGDMPWVRAETLARILDTYRFTDARIVVPVHGGRRGNPVLFDRSYFDSLKNLEGDRGGRAVLREEPLERVDVSDPGIHRDVDRPGDLEARE